VRRLLDIVACTTSFGSSGKQAEVKPSSHEPGKGVAQGAAGIMAEVTGNLPTTTVEDSESVRKEADAQVSESTSKAEIDKAAFTKSEKTVFSSKPEAVAAMAAAKEEGRHDWNVPTVQAWPVLRVSIILPFNTPSSMLVLLYLITHGFFGLHHRLIYHLLLSLSGL